MAFVARVGRLDVLYREALRDADYFDIFPSREAVRNSAHFESTNMYVPLVHEFRALALYEWRSM